ncbi:MAG: FAD-dependent thymidylate synthase [Candidatus Shapirobacteria bacterium]|nr:FAD-dependent thymidylate synthase [Candidatus Shapirobacteria bacterium]MDD5073815.1 FAD-dependent thymidylate synthase [Candidatus Shapirobacteria bacterium]MDD5481500.1 FAD-dependent thymidylate synthase [Candidatus Shapirobacteria bacterium]
MKVRLIAQTQDSEATVTAAIRQCYSSAGADQLVKKADQKNQERLIGLVMASGHTSTIEHASFTFAIEGISRACSHQLVRHRIASFSQQSQRYVDLSKGEITYIIPPKISYSKERRKEFHLAMEKVETVYRSLIKSGVSPEDARFILPNACETKIVVTMNARALANFFRLRTCLRAQWEIRALAGEMMRLVKEAAPLLFANAGPSCQTEKICWEGELTCGLWKKIPGAELRTRG